MKGKNSCVHYAARMTLKLSMRRMAHYITGSADTEPSAETQAQEKGFSLRARLPAFPSSTDRQGAHNRYLMVHTGYFPFLC